MELEKLWQSFTNESGKTEMSDEMISESIRIKSKDTIGKISNTLKIKLGWGILFSAISFGLLIYHINTTNLLIIMTFSTMYFSFSSLYVYVRIKKAGKLDHGMNIKQFIQNYYSQVKSLLRTEEIESVFVIPVFAIIGILYSTILIHGTFDAVLTNTKLLLTAIVLLITVVPFAVLFVQWANKKAFGKYLETLQKIINNFNH
jgi:hypothetical protein